MIGRFCGGFILRRFRPGRVLMAFAIGAIILIAVSAFTRGAIAGWALVLVGFTNSIMFPTIFSLATEGMTTDTPKASGLLCTAIVGGAIVPVLIGLTADSFGLTAGLVVPVICYALIARFGHYADSRAHTVSCTHSNTRFHHRLLP